MAMEVNAIRLARVYSGLTQKGLATRLGKKQYIVADFERSGDASALKESLKEATGLPIGFFSEDIVWHSPQSNISYRKRSICPAGDRDRAWLYSAVAASILEPLVARFIRYPDVDMPESPADNPLSDNVDARRAGGAIARVVREEWGIGWGPISDVIRLVESKGVRVFFLKRPVESLDGFACWVKDRPFMFLNSFVADPARLRFNAAHELLHLVAHRDIELDSDSGLYESMAHGFAAEFLAPWATFSRECPVIPRLDRLGQLRRRWGMSMQSIVMHMHANGAISDASYATAFKKFSYLGYRRGPEPGWFAPDTSAVHEKFFEVLKARGISLTTLAEEAGIPEPLLTEMLPESSLAFY